MFWSGGFFRKSSCAAGGRAGRGGRDAGIHAGNGVGACRGDGGGFQELRLKRSFVTQSRGSRSCEMYIKHAGISV